MPYIKFENRLKYDIALNKLPEIETKGDLEYIVFKVMKKYMSNRDFKYSTLHDTVYAVMHCGHEYLRRYLDKREDEARKLNGDVNEF